MKRVFAVAAVIAAFGLGGCVAVPVADPYPYYGPPAAVVVQPSVTFGYSSGYYSPGPRHWHGHRRWHGG